MKNLFAGLENLGFTEKDLPQDSLYQKKEQNKPADESKSIPLQDFVYLKQFKCPVCDSSFYNVEPKQRMAKLVKTDTDLRPYFEPIEPFYYGVTMCYHCGYASIPPTFLRLRDKQILKIKEKISSNFKSREYSLILTPDEALERYKMALLNCLVKEAKSSEKAFICLKIAWIYRDKKDIENEKEFLKNSFVGFEKAYSDEAFPMYGFDENTLAYTLADVARRIGEFDTSLRYLTKVLTSPSVPSRLKDRALTIKQMIRDEQRSISGEEEKLAPPPPKEAPKRKGFFWSKK